MLSFHTDCRLEPLRSREPLVEHDCDAIEGDSGSPLLVGSGDDVSVAALHIGYSGRGPNIKGLAIGVDVFATEVDELIGSRAGRWQGRIDERETIDSMYAPFSGGSTGRVI